MKSWAYRPPSCCWGEKENVSLHMGTDKWTHTHKHTFRATYKVGNIVHLLVSRKKYRRIFIIDRHTYTPTCTYTQMYPDNFNINKKSECSSILFPKGFCKPPTILLSLSTFAALRRSVMTLVRNSLGRRKYGITNTFLLWAGEKEKNNYI